MTNREVPGLLELPPPMFRLACRTPQPATGQQSSAGAAPYARASTTRRACSTRHPFPHGERTVQCSCWSVTRQTPHATSPRASSKKAPRRVALPGAPPHDLRVASAGDALIGNVDPPLRLLSLHVLGFPLLGEVCYPF